MAGQGVYMDVPVVRDMGKKFGNIGEVLTTVNKALETLSNILKATAFVGLVGGYAVAQFIDNMRPQIEDMAEKCEELNKDLEASANAYENGDEAGSARFH